MSDTPGWIDRAFSLYFLAVNGLFALAFLVTWLDADALGEHAFRDLVIITLLELVSILVTASAYAPWPKRLVVLPALAVGALFAWGFGIAYGTAWPLAWFAKGGVLALFSIRKTLPPEATARAGLTMVALILAVLASVIVPWPALGAGAEHAPEAGGATGLFVESPHRALVAGFLYFGALAAVEVLVLRGGKFDLRSMGEQAPDEKA